MTATSTRRNRKFYTRVALGPIAALWVIRECTDHSPRWLLIFSATLCNGYPLRVSNRARGGWHPPCSTSDLIANMKGGSP